MKNCNPLSILINAVKSRTAITIFHINESCLEEYKYWVCRPLRRTLIKIKFTYPSTLGNVVSEYIYGFIFKKKKPLEVHKQTPMKGVGGRI